MTKYVALLRGINVGGKNVIKMEALRTEFERMGFLSLKTYIQSGNVLFRSELKDTVKIERKIEKALKTKFNYAAKALVRSEEQMEGIVAHFPKIFGDSAWKHNVVFLSAAIDSAAILERFEIKKDIERIYYCKGVLFWSAKLEMITRSTMLKLSARKEYQEMTVRNVNTTKKISELMKTNH